MITTFKPLGLALLAAGLALGTANAQTGTDSSSTSGSSVTTPARMTEEDSTMVGWAFLV